jgi:RND family efflux transporter MFP subunit
VIFTVADIHHVWAVGRAPERVISELGEGQTATLRLQAYPGDSFPGTISLLSPMLDESTRTLDVRVELDDESGRLRAGLFGSLALGTSDDAVLTVPDGALARIEGSDVVFVPGDAAGHFRAVPVVVGHRSMGLCEIERGVAEGDAVVTSGAFTLKSELLAAEMEED